MADAPPFRSLADFAASLGVSERTVRRHLETAMQEDPGLRVTRIGRAIRFTPAQWDRALKAMEWRSPVAETLDRLKEKRRHVRYDARQPRDGQTAQEAALSLARSMLPPPRRPRPEKG